MSVSILIVDDAAFIREALLQICTAAGGLVVGEASSGTEGVAQALKLRPAIVIMDLVMPEKNGVEAIREIMAVLPDTKIIACSSVDQEFLINKAMQAGATCFLPKPFKKIEVIEMLRKLTSVRSQVGGSHV